MMKHEGLLEGDALYHFEVSPQIASYREQPITLNYPNGNRTRRYTPDFEIVLQSGEQVYIEIKPERNLAKEEVQQKLTWVSDYLKRSGIRFVTLTEHELRQEPRRANLIWLYRQTPRKKPNLDAQRTVIDRYKLSFPMTFGESQSLLAESGVDVFSLLASGWLRCDLETAITPSTQLYLTGGKDNEWFFISQKHGFWMAQCKLQNHQTGKEWRCCAPQPGLEASIASRDKLLLDYSAGNVRVLTVMHGNLRCA
jgi:hypothetical protein